MQTKIIVGLFVGAAWAGTVSVAHGETVEERVAKATTAIRTEIAKIRAEDSARTAKRAEEMRAAEESRGYEKTMDDGLVNLGFDVRVDPCFFTRHYVMAFGLRDAIRYEITVDGYRMQVGGRDVVDAKSAKDFIEKTGHLRAVRTAIDGLKADGLAVIPSNIMPAMRDCPRNL